MKVCPNEGCGEQTEPKIEPSVGDRHTLVEVDYCPYCDENVNAIEKDYDGDWPTDTPQTQDELLFQLRGIR